MDKADKGLRLVTVLSGNLPPPGEELRLRHDQIFSKDPFGALDVLNAFSSALPTFIESTNPERARGTVEKMINVDGLFPAISRHLGTSLSPEVPKTTRERMSMTCLQVLESVFRLFEGYLTVDWYKLGVDVVLKSTNNVTSSSAIVGNPSTIYAYCALGIINHVVIGQLRSRIAQDLPPTGLNTKEQLFVREVYTRLFPGREQEQKLDQFPAYLIPTENRLCPNTSGTSS
ncbi:hypothetical protein BC826DRAFT_162162 [Russula brevipes]|nr:hypothetical protein BC826DRAFT_162162 [Russula brevipes]